MLRRILVLSLITLCVLLVWRLHAAPQPSIAPPLQEMEGDVPEFETRLPEVRFEGVTLETAFNRLADMAHANIAIDWDAVEFGSTVKRDRPITLHLTNVTFRQAFITLLCLGSDQPPLMDYYTESGALVVGPMWHVYDRWHTRVYELRDIIDDNEQFVRAHGPKDDAIGHDCHVVVDRITRTIESTVEPNCWQEKGGADIITELGGRLIITTSRENHHRIAALFEGLRKPRESALYTTSPR